MEVEQTVFGMDCAPCAYGVERSLSRLPGVETVNVRLNQGKVFLTLAPGNRVTIEQLRARIRDNGFTPKEAYIRAVGRLIFREDRMELVIAPATVLRLTSETERGLLWDKLKKAEPGATAEIAGRIAQDPGEPPLISVTNVIFVAQPDPSG